jgi:hypothetical protein
MSATVIVAGPRNGITAEKIENEINSKKLEPVTSGGKKYSGDKKIIIEGFDFTSNEDGGKQLSVTDCEDVTIRFCKFRNKTTKGQGLNIVGSNTKRVTVEYCLFENFTFTDDNGGEPFRFGLSQYSGCNYDSVIRKCVFRNCKSDPEVISLKSSNNTVEDCFFIDNKSNVTVRHGGLNKIQHNYFSGSGGVRIHGYGNYVGANCFENNQETESFAPIIIRYGNADKDPNFNDVKTPSGKAAGDGHAVYAKTVDLRIEGNEFKNCRRGIIQLAKGASIKPENVVNKNNKVVQEFGFTTGGANPLPAPELPVEPAPVEPVRPTKPADPNEEQPVVTPTKDDAQETHMCGIFKHEEAKNHLHLYACGEHANILREKFKRILKETEEETRRNQDDKDDDDEDDDDKPEPVKPQPQPQPEPVKPTKPEPIKPEPVKPQPQPVTSPTGSADKYGIKKLYADAPTKFERYMDMDNPTKDAFLNKEEKANLNKEADGGWSLDGKDTGKYQVRLGLWMKPEQVNIETTVYSQYISAVAGADSGSYAFQLYKGVGDHSTSNNGCTGFSYKGRVRLDKGVLICKEVTHPNYSSNEGNIKKLTNDPKGRYVGTKLVTYNLAKDSKTGRTPVKIEVYCDETGMTPDGKFDKAKQNWVKMADYVDKGGWNAGSAASVGLCPPLEIGNSTGKRKTDEIYNLPVGTNNGNVVTYRTDGVRTKIKYFSVRGIKPSS